ncbi:uncharacterized protein LOC125237308 [Leguminivora glycinivorella]|uniref:uncharacterized protein LOC125237308 n=1 Tax=Leguminivora glycinivorella TaxID=1035111 RepID=UPI00200D3DC1|nr:uncharacterized protein LOC125237308 [Leguminivora glycinivorella]
MTNQIRKLFTKQALVYPDDYKTVRAYKYFRSSYFLSAVLGYDFFPFTISKSRIVRIIFAIYAFSVSIGFSYLVLHYVKYLQSSPYVYVAVEYITTVILLLFMSAHRRAKFLRTLEMIDDKLHVDESYYCRIMRITQAFVIIAILMRFFYSMVVCFSFKVNCDESPVIVFTTGFILIAVDANQVPRLLTFFMIKFRMSLLRKKVENLFQNTAISVIDTKDKRKSLLLYQDIYEDILDSINVISKIINPFFLLSLVCSFPKIMLLLYNVIVLQKRGVPIIHLIALGLEAVQWALIPCLPGILFEMTRDHVDKMKLFLLKHYKESTRNNHPMRMEIKEFLDYIELRPCRYLLYRFIPVDLSLPVCLFHLCTTYLIVMIQFSHLFEDDA